MLIFINFDFSKIPIFYRKINILKNRKFQNFIGRKKYPKIYFQFFIFIFFLVTPQQRHSNAVRQPQRCSGTCYDYFWCGSVAGPFSRHFGSIWDLPRTRYPSSGIDKKISGTIVFLQFRFSVSYIRDLSKPFGIDGIGDQRCILAHLEDLIRVG